MLFSATFVQGAGQISFPTALAIDATRSCLYVTDFGGKRLTIVSTAPKIAGSLRDQARDSPLGKRSVICGRTCYLVVPDIPRIHVLHMLQLPVKLFLFVIRYSGHRLQNIIIMN